VALNVTELSTWPTSQFTPGLVGTDQKRISPRSVILRARSAISFVRTRTLKLASFTKRTRKEQMNNENLSHLI
jgi:hypothetical protein